MPLGSGQVSQPPEEIQAYCHQMLHDVAPGDRFLVGITENIPEDRWQTSLTTISGIIKEHGTLPLTHSMHKLRVEGSVAAQWWVCGGDRPGDW